MSEGQGPRADAVFISDVHLHPDQPEITQRFERWVQWALTHTKSVYVLGDFFYAWTGDDLMDAFTWSIVPLWRQLTDAGIRVFYLPGNRDFLLGPRFLEAAGIKRMIDPYVLSLEGQTVLLTHGDQYCTGDIIHQRFRRLTRNALFSKIFLCLPKWLRQTMVQRVRRYSEQHTGQKSAVQMDVSESAVLADMDRHGLKTLIHGHTHKPARHVYDAPGGQYLRYVLSDWDANPRFLWYTQKSGFEFIQPL
ncbi:MAG: UDP-2,3-diacylglucosamine diphosphatase [Legionellaceae bacterium]|nr:UDP-2,3-diacylglucosamine diphosphatase [Legionellaceae bacterium]